MKPTYLPNVDTHWICLCHPTRLIFLNTSLHCACHATIQQQLGPPKTAMIIVRGETRSPNVNFTVYITFLSPSISVRWVVFFVLFVILLRYITPPPPARPPRGFLQTLVRQHWQSTLLYDFKKQSIIRARVPFRLSLPPPYREFATAAVRYPPTPRGPRARKHYVNTLGVFYCGRIYV